MEADASRTTAGSAAAADKKKVLQAASFGERIAEQEISNLSDYFVETDQWRRLLAGEVDIVYGPKGSGKSALYSLLSTRADELFDRGILIVPAENPSGATAFADVVTEPPTSEGEFVGLWKLYFLSLLAQILQEYGVETPQAKSVYKALQEAGLLQEKGPLKALLRAAREYARAVTKAEAVEGGIVIEPNTGMPIGVTGKITFREPSAELQAAGLVSIDSLLEAADRALGDLRFTVWLVLDRLDVAFEQHEALEQNALRALFKAYLDMQSLTQIGVKIFLRTDIWRRITTSGFREASHITRNLTIAWDRQSLCNVVMRRALKNREICEYYGVDPDAVVTSVQAQEDLLRRMFPDQVDAGRNPATFDWMLSRTQDGTTQTAPRELIHLLSSVRDSQLRRYEIGHSEPPNEQLFDRPAFKDALKQVSETRLTQTLFAEYPSLKQYIEQLDGEKTQQTPETLGRIWGKTTEEARELAEQLVEVGFFEKRGSKQNPSYWVPFLYRDALNLVQGEAR
ncbi:MAG TPA: hypothetical protein VF520_02015 [Thermoleophilaceae bacterium]